MNKANIWKLADHIEQLDPREYDQSVFAHDCGTPACVAGHALALAGRWEEADGGSEGFALPFGVAMDWLGLDDVAAERLFVSYPWGRFDDATRQDAAATLRHLAETGEVRWKSATP